MSGRCDSFIFTFSATLNSKLSVLVRVKMFVSPHDELLCFMTEVDIWNILLVS